MYDGTEAVETRRTFHSTMHSHSVSSRRDAYNMQGKGKGRKRVEEDYGLPEMLLKAPLMVNINATAGTVTHGASPTACRCTIYIAFASSQQRLFLLTCSSRHLKAINKIN